MMTYIVLHSQSYLKTKLKQKLNKGEQYCVSLFVNVRNVSSLGVDCYDILLGDVTLDTIKSCPAEVGYLVPQISQPASVFITDTLNWVPLRGIYTANGNESYFLFGNLRGIASTNTVLLNANTLPALFNDVCIDDVSCVPINLPANAGPDKHFFVGDSVYIGRPLDVGTDYACTWYQLPFTNIPMPGVSGMWVKPVQTTTFVVAQQLWCSGVKYDTVVVYKDAVGIKDLDVYLQSINLFPNPANNKLSIQFTQVSIISGIKNITVYNHLGENVDAPVSSMTEEELQLDCSNLTEGVYYIRFELESGGSFVKRFVVGR